MTQDINSNMDSSYSDHISQGFSKQLNMRFDALAELVLPRFSTGDLDGQIAVLTEVFGNQAHPNYFHEKGLTHKTPTPLFSLLHNFSTYCGHSAFASVSDYLGMDSE